MCRNRTAKQPYSLFFGGRHTECACYFGLQTPSLAAPRSENRHTDRETRSTKKGSRLPAIRKRRSTKRRDSPVAVPAFLSALSNSQGYCPGSWGGFETTIVWSLGLPTVRTRSLGKIPAFVKYRGFESNTPTLSRFKLSIGQLQGLFLSGEPQFVQSSCLNLTNPLLRHAEIRTNFFQRLGFLTMVKPKPTNDNLLLPLVKPR